MRRLLAGTSVITVCIFLAGCPGHETARASWDDVLKKCGVNDLTGPHVLYFGPSNSIGPGSVWRAPEDGGYRLRYATSDMPDPKTFINRGQSFSCNGSSVSNFDIQAGLSVSTSVTPASAELSNDFKKATNITVKAGSVAWDQISEGPFEDYVNKLPPGTGVAADLARPNRLVMYQALRVTGFSAELEFSAGDAAGLKAKYSGGIAKVATADVGANLSANWSANNKLTLASSGDFYIAGTFEPYNSTGLSAAGKSSFGKPIIIQKGSTLGRDPID